MHRFRAGQKLVPEDGVVIDRVGKKYRLRVPAVELGHANCYTVKAVNIAGDATAQATLHVTG